MGGEQNFEVKERPGYKAKECRKRHLLPQGKERLLNRLEEPISKMIQDTYFLSPIIWKALGVASQGSFFRAEEERAWIMGRTLD